MQMLCQNSFFISLEQSIHSEAKINESSITSELLIATCNMWVPSELVNLVVPSTTQCAYSGKEQNTRLSLREIEALLQWFKEKLPRLDCWMTRENEPFKFPKAKFTRVLRRGKRVPKFFITKSKVEKSKNCKRGDKVGFQMTICLEWRGTLLPT